MRVLVHVVFVGGNVQLLTKVSQCFSNISGK